MLEGEDSDDDIDGYIDENRVMMVGVSVLCYIDVVDSVIVIMYISKLVSIATVI